MSAKPQITKPSRLIAAAKAGEDNLVAEYLTENKKLDVNKVNPFFSFFFLWCSFHIAARQSWADFSPLGCTLRISHYLQLVAEIRRRPKHSGQDW